MKERACTGCNLITQEEVCPNCGGSSFSEEWMGCIIVLDPEDSQIAKRLEISKPGKYALKVKTK